MGNEAIGEELISELETELREQSVVLVDPQQGECLACFVLRVIQDFGCDTSLRWSQRFRDLRVPRATGLERRLGDMGGFCDCELFLNSYELDRELCERDVHTDDLIAPQVMPTCSGVRRGSTQPCRNWVRQRRGR